MHSPMAKKVPSLTMLQCSHVRIGGFIKCIPRVVRIANCVWLLKTQGGGEGECTVLVPAPLVHYALISGTICAN